MATTSASWFVLLGLLQLHGVWAYQAPTDSMITLGIRSDGSLTFEVVYNEWTGLWTTDTVLAAGKPSVVAALLLEVSLPLW